MNLKYYRPRICSYTKKEKTLSVCFISIFQLYSSLRTEGTMETFYQQGTNKINIYSIVYLKYRVSNMPVITEQWM